MKKIRLFIIMTFICLICGCGSEKQVLTSENFFELMSEKKYQVYDDKENFTFAEHAYVIKEKDLKIVFVEGKRKTDIEGIYVDQVNNIYASAKEGYEDDKSSGKNWSTLKLKDSDNYYYISLVDNTYLYIEGSIDKENKITKIVDMLGY